LPWSPGATSDDVRLVDVSHFEGLEVVVTEKLDGENTTMYRDYIHARSIDSRRHPSRDWVKGLHATIAHQIPAGWRLCGENVFAQHSVSYDNLESYFYVFSIWNEENLALSWDETVDWVELLGLVTPPVLYTGTWDELLIRRIEVDATRVEGYVVRLASAFTHADFSQSIAKWVRRDHVQSEEHWIHSAVVPNRLRGK
jgi:hypothetical protein